jgi:hypothetical protein
VKAKVIPLIWFFPYPIITENPRVEILTGGYVKRNLLVVAILFSSVLCFAGRKPAQTPTAPTPSTPTPSQPNSSYSATSETAVVDESALSDDLAFQLTSNFLTGTSGKLITEVDFLRKKRKIFYNLILAAFDEEKSAGGTSKYIEFSEMRAIGAGMFFKGNFQTHGGYAGLDLANFRFYSAKEGLSNDFGLALIVGYQFRIKENGLAKIQATGASRQTGQLTSLALLLGVLF